ncbi:MAG: hypothetical protein WC438_02065 [Candidatus Pacearchaeota archaeon]
MVESIFQSIIFMDYILPFVLIFTLVFAILQKTKLLGDSVKQINALVGLVAGLILIAFPFSRDIVLILMPFLAVSATILLVFMLLYAFVWGHSGDAIGHKWVKIVIGILLAIGLISVVLYAAGLWEPIYDFLFNRGDSGQLWVNIILIVIMAGAVIAVILPKDKGEDKSKKE